MLNYYRSLPSFGSRLLWKRLDNEVCEQVQERNKTDIETETVAYINNVTVACNLGLFVGPLWFS